MATEDDKKKTGGGKSDYDKILAIQNNVDGLSKLDRAKKTRTPSTFGEAFKAARKAKKDIFTWNGGKYTTELKKSKKATKPKKTTTPKKAIIKEKVEEKKPAAPKVEVKEQEPSSTANQAPVQAPGQSQVQVQSQAPGQSQTPALNVPKAMAMSDIAERSGFNTLKNWISSVDWGARELPLNPAPPIPPRTMRKEAPPAPAPVYKDHNVPPTPKHMSMRDVRNIAADSWIGNVFPPSWRIKEKGGILYKK